MDDIIAMEKDRSGQHNRHDAKKETRRSSEYVDLGIKTWDYAYGLLLRRHSSSRRDSVAAYNDQVASILSSITEAM